MMTLEITSQPILLVEDDDNDIVLLTRAIKNNHISNPIRITRDGSDAINYLMGAGKYSDRDEYPLPCFIVVDLKMPKVNGLQLLEWIRAHPNFRCIPLIVVTSSERDEDIKAAYELGAHSYIIKPSDSAALHKIVRAAYNYWARTMRGMRS